MTDSTALDPPRSDADGTGGSTNGTGRPSTAGAGFDLGALFRRSTTPRPPVYGQHHFVTIGVFLVAVALIAPEIAQSRSDQFLVNLWLVYCITGIGFYWVFGLAGKFAFCQTFMMALGGFTSAYLTRPDGPNQPFLVGVAGAIAVTCVIALLLGLSVRRAQHFYFAIATLALESIGHTVFKEWTDFTGPNGTTVGVPPAKIGGTEFLQESEVFRLFLGALAIVLVLAALIERSPLRREAVAARDNLLVANVAGVRADRHQLTLLVLGSGLGGLSGALIAHWNGVIGIDSFGIDLAIGIFLMLLLGGSGSMWGPVLGAAFYVAVPDLLSGIERYSAMVYGLVLLVVVIAMPEGLVGAVRKGSGVVLRLVDQARGRPGTTAVPAVAVAGAGGGATAAGDGAGDPVGTGNGAGPAEAGPAQGGGDGAAG
ncbi:MAG TPA: branched-chain amino acid ABC transporter permease [Acidimicrobiales bacterium]